MDTRLAESAAGYSHRLVVALRLLLAFAALSGVVTGTAVAATDSDGDGTNAATKALSDNDGDVLPITTAGRR